MNPLIQTLVINPTEHRKDYNWLPPGGLSVEPLSTVKVPFDVYTAAGDLLRESLLSDIAEGRVVITYIVRPDIKAVKGEEEVSIKKPEEAVEKLNSIKDKAVDAVIVDDVKEKQQPVLFTVEKNVPFKDSMTLKISDKLNTDVLNTSPFVQLEPSESSSNKPNTLLF